MAIKIGGTTVIDDSRNLVNIVSGAGASTTAGAVGTYAMAGGLQFTSQFNTTRAGSSLRPRNTADHGTFGYLAGTWRCMGYHTYETNWNAGNTAIWVRIS